MAVIALERERNEVVRVGLITPGEETNHKLPGDETERVFMFDMACKFLFQPFVDKDQLIQPREVEIKTIHGKYLISKDFDEQGHPTLAILLRQGSRDHAVSVIDTPEGKFVEQHEFREVYGLDIEHEAYSLKRESAGYPLLPEQYEIFDHVTDALTDPATQLRVVAYA